MRLRAALRSIGLECFPKTSGSKGMQVYAPLNTPATYPQTRAVSKAVAVALERAEPDLVVSEMTKSKRAGKVFVDWSQNAEHKTTVGVYSLRAMPRPTVSTPITWDEVEAVRRLARPRGPRLHLRRRPRPRRRARRPASRPSPSSQQSLPAI